MASGDILVYIATSASLFSGRYVSRLRAFPFFNTTRSSVIRVADNPIFSLYVE